MEMKVLIFEDDISTGLDYEIILEKIGITKIRQIKTLANAESAISDYHPDIVLLDIYLQDGMGLELLPKLKSMDIPTIVITSFTEEKFADLALKYQVESFLSKPVDKNTLKFEIKRLQSKIKEREEQSYFYIAGKNRLGKIRINEILYIITEGNYTSFVTKRKKHIVKKSLTNIMDDLDKNKFCRIFRNIAVNIHNIKSIDYSNNKVVMEPDDVLPLGNTYKNNLKEITRTKFKII